MIELVIGLVLILVGGSFMLRSRSAQGRKALGKASGGVLAILIGLTLFFTRSFVIVDQDEVGHLSRIYLGASLPPGQIIAANGEKGPQAKVLGPGFHFMPFVRVLYDVEYFPVVEVQEGTYAFLLARDGEPLREDQFISDPWPKDQFREMLDAQYFLTDGGGQKGPQLTVLQPGKYRLNRYLFDVDLHKAVDVPTGHVAVIRSNVQTEENCPAPTIASGSGTDQQVSTPIVPRGCIGVWDEPVRPGRYYLNNRAFVPTIIPTRLQTWSYKGGYTKRQINLRVNDNGTIEQSEVTSKELTPASAADRAIFVRVEGWTVPVEMRVVVQVHPEDAATVVASVGDLQKIEDNIITPAVRDVLRSIGGAPERKALDFIEKRDEITALVESALSIEGHKAGVTIQEVRLGEPAIPPELLVARLREQLATQLKETYEKERQAQTERIKVERERAAADQQPTLVAAEIAKAAAAHRKEQLRLEGEGEKLKQIEIALGQEAQAKVLGKERTLQLQALEKILLAAQETPQIVKVPTVQVQGSEGGYEGAAAVLGASNIIQMMKGLQKTERKIAPE